MYTIPHLLASAGVTYADHPQWPGRGVFLTTANQIMGTYADLRQFQPSRADYFGWHAHHIIEDQDLERLGIQQQCPPYARQVCVLLPRDGHEQRLNSLLRHQNPSNQRVTAEDLKRAYRDAYWLLGDYCGGGESRIREELVNIVLAVFRSAGL